MRITKGMQFKHRHGMIITVLETDRNNTTVQYDTGEVKTYLTQTVRECFINDKTRFTTIR